MTGSNTHTMRVLVGALLAVLAARPGLPGSADLAVTIEMHQVARSCAVVSTATIVAFDARAPRDITYRFLRSDGSVSPAGRLAFAGDGAVAQSVRDTWTPRGASPWVALEITAPEHVRSQRIAVTPGCRHRMVATTH